MRKKQKQQRRFIRALATGVAGVLAVVGVGWGTASPAAAAAWDPFSSATEMVVAQYGDFLGRAPTTTERLTWEGRLGAGTHGRSHLVASLRDSTDNLSVVDPIARLYWTALVRPPDRLGFNHWVAQRRTGARTVQQIADVFVTTADYAAAYGGTTNTQFVNRLYENVYGWAGDPAGVAYWVSLLNAGQTRARVLLQFQEAPASIAALQARVNVSVCVIAMFRRTPTGSDITTHGAYATIPAILAEVFFQHPDYYYP